MFFGRQGSVGTVTAQFAGRGWKLTHARCGPDLGKPLRDLAQGWDEWGVCLLFAWRGKLPSGKGKRKR